MKLFYKNIINNIFLFFFNFLNFNILIIFISKSKLKNEILGFELAELVTSFIINSLIGAINDMICMFLEKAMSSNNKIAVKIIFYQTLIFLFIFYIIFSLIFIKIGHFLVIINMNYEIVQYSQIFFNYMVIGLFFIIINIIYQCLLINLKVFYLSVVINILQVISLYLLLLFLTQYHNISIHIVGISIIINNLIFIIIKIIIVNYYNKFTFFSKITLQEISIEFIDKFNFIIKRFFSSYINNFGMMICSNFMNRSIDKSQTESFNLGLNLIMMINYFIYSFYLSIRIAICECFGLQKYEKARSKFKYIYRTLIFTVLCVLIIIIFQDFFIDRITNNKKTKILFKKFIIFIIIQTVLHNFVNYIKIIVRLARLDNLYVYIGIVNVSSYTIVSYLLYLNNCDVFYFMLIINMKDVIYVLMYIINYKYFKWEYLISVEKSARKKLDDQINELIKDEKTY